MLVDEFECWPRDSEQRIKGYGYAIEFVRSDQAPMPTAYIILDSEDYGAFIAVRNDGLYDLEVLDYDSGELILTDHRGFETAEEMLTTLNGARVLGRSVRGRAVGRAHPLGRTRGTL